MLVEIANTLVEPANRLVEIANTPKALANSAQGWSLRQPWGDYLNMALQR